MANLIKINDPELGDIIISQRVMKSITARWKDGVLHVHAPITFSLDEIMVGINSMRQRILSRPPSPTLKYYDGMVINGFDSVNIIIKIAKDNEPCIKCRFEDNIYQLKVSSLLEINDSRVTEAISRMLSRVMHSEAAKHLIPRAERLARELKLAPKGFVIGRGKRKLGHCTSTGVIQLSHNLMFLPNELVDYIIYHELAHLTEMNHSDKFHALCNKYCKGREHEYKNQLRNHTWCILR